MKRILSKIPYAIAIAYIPLVFILPLFVRDDGGFIDMPYAMYVLAGFLYTFPCCIAIMEICKFVFVCHECPEISKRQKVLHGIGGGVCIGIVATWFFLDMLVYISLVLAGGIVFIWILEALMEKRKIRFGIIWKDKTIWILALILIVAITGIVSVLGNAQSGKNRREDPMVPVQAVGVEISI